MQDLTEGTVLVSDHRSDAQNRPPVSSSRKEAGVMWTVYIGVLRNLTEGTVLLSANVKDFFT